MKKPVISTMAQPTTRRVASKTSAIRMPPTMRSFGVFSPYRMWKALMSQIVQSWTNKINPTKAKSMPSPSALRLLRASPSTQTGSYIELRKSGFIKMASVSMTLRWTDRNERPSGVP